MKKRTRRQFLHDAGVTGFTIAALPSWLKPFGKSDRVPNIVLIYADDQGYADLGCYGAKGFTTPNIDSIAAQGIRFTSFYVSQAVCSASRASLLTGCYSERVGIQGALNPNAVIGLSSEEETIASVLKKAGYATAILGKWHLGHHREFLPLQHGFDEYFGLPYSNDMWPVDFDGKPATTSAKAAYPPLPLIEANDVLREIKTLADQDQLTTLYTERAVRFIEKHRKRPFFLYLPHSMPHVPLGVSGKFKGKSKQGMYGNVIMEIDWSVGEILRTLKKDGLENDTIVMYASDNGPWLNFGNHAGSAGPLREAKGTMWEGGCRVPCVVRWPGKIPAGKVCSNIASTIDILPTLAAIAGAHLPKNRIDGVNIIPLLLGEKNVNPRNHFFYYYGGELQAVREGRWKLHFPHRYRSYKGVQPGNDGKPGPYATGETGIELYDLESDVGETTNVAVNHPDVVERLKTLAQRAREDLGDRLTGATGSGIRQPGRKGGTKKTTVKHLAVGKEIRLGWKPSSLYAGGGDRALIDGVRGSIDHQDGAWQGFEGEDLDVDIDLGSAYALKRITCGFLESQGSWIFHPSLVQFEISADGQTFDLLQRVKIPAERPSNEPAVKDVAADVPEGRMVRFVRVKAESIRICPPWHAGAGSKAWLFSDEIVIEER